MINPPAQSESKLGTSLCSILNRLNGNAIISEGNYQNNKFVFTSSQMRRGILLIDKITIQQMDENHLHWHTETSLDGGESWISFWEMEYKRMSH